MPETTGRAHSPPTATGDEREPPAPTESARDARRALGRVSGVPVSLPWSLPGDTPELPAPPDAPGDDT